MDILHNHIGYKAEDIKRVILQFHSLQESSLYENATVEIVDLQQEKEIYFCKKEGEGEVAGWKNRYFIWFDFTKLSHNGTYFVRVRCEGVENSSFPFTISNYIFSKSLFSDFLFYFKGQRSSGRWDATDSHVPFYGSRKDKIDAHGGWFDASGDYSKYLSHLSYANYFNPQQTPMTVYSLLFLHKTLIKLPEHSSSLLCERALEEALWGADFLMRMQDKEGYFYTTLFDKWSKKSDERMICTFSTQKGHRSEDYQSGFRQGGGMAIASLALASIFNSEMMVPSSFTHNQYLNSAIRGYEHLLFHNVEYLDNHKENLIDYYCALMASNSLYLATKDDYYKHQSTIWASSIIDLYSDEDHCWHIEKGNDRPYFHASDSGLPFVALMGYYTLLTCENEKERIYQFLKKTFSDLLKRAKEVVNPFMLSRQRMRSVGKSSYTNFFIPHENETGYWWQGENARLASEATACKMMGTIVASREGENEFFNALNQFGQSQIDFIFGCNPYNICMMNGHGRNNPQYEKNSPNALGGICNGITSGFIDEMDVDFLPSSVADRGDHRWRWSEQWIPHATWMIFALSVGAQ